MNLYKMNFIHYSPKDNEKGIKEYFLASHDDDLIKKFVEYSYYSFCENCEVCNSENPSETMNGLMLHYGEDDMNYFCEEYASIYDKDKFDCLKDEILYHKGDCYREEDLENLYYGKTQFQWELVKENITEAEIEVLKNLEILNTKQEDF